MSRILFFFSAYLCRNRNNRVRTEQRSKRSNMNDINKGEKRIASFFFPVLIAKQLSTLFPKSDFQRHSEKYHYLAVNKTLWLTRMNAFNSEDVNSTIYISTALKHLGL